MYRRDFVKRSGLALSGLTLSGLTLAGRPLVAGEPGEAHTGGSDDHHDPDDRINVAFVISPNANVIDVAGPWEVFQDTMLGRGDDHFMPFRLYTVSDSADPLEATGGLTLVPDYTLSEAPTPRIVSVGAQRGSPEIHRWIREQAGRAEALMSVCTGAFQLGRAGVLDGRRATTHHEFWDSFVEEFPEVTLVRGRRFVDEGDIISAGGLTSGIDAALHVVARMMGPAVAERTARYMEYESDGWRSGEKATPSSGAGAAEAV